jgi:NAD(P)-dependent dehydrogenase (short-subunit alcohol dehydrogenase family)
MAEGRAAIITGGGQGIGKAVAGRLLAQGFRVVIGEIDHEAGAETAEELGRLGDIAFLPADVADEESVHRLVSHTVDRCGRLDALVNNAGIADPYTGPVEELTLERWQRLLRVNLTGCFLCAKHAIPHLRLTNGSIVNIGSTRALQSEPHTEAYAAAKGGLLALTHALAVSLGPAIRVNCISPGWIDVSGWRKKSRRQPSGLRPADHAQHPAGRVGIPEDVAGLAAFLLSEEAGFVTGQNFLADGGMTRKMIYE